MLKFTLSVLCIPLTIYVMYLKMSGSFIANFKFKLYIEVEYRRSLIDLFDK